MSNLLLNSFQRTAEIQGFLQAKGLGRSETFVGHKDSNHLIRSCVKSGVERYELAADSLQRFRKHIDVGLHQLHPVSHSRQLEDNFQRGALTQVVNIRLERGPQTNDVFRLEFFLTR